MAGITIHRTGPARRSVAVKRLRSAPRWAAAMEWRESVDEPAMGALTIFGPDGRAETVHEFVSRDTAQRIADARRFPLRVTLV
jgi:hypothetical protein